MLPRNARFKVWAALLGIGGWFAGCFALVAYRLKSDDLELMEREVYEELKLKKEVKRFQEKQRRLDHLASPSEDKDAPIITEDNAVDMVGEVEVRRPKLD